MGFTHQSTGNLLTATPVKKNEPRSPWQPWIACSSLSRGGVSGTVPTHAGLLSGLVSWRFYTGNLGFCEFMGAIAMSRLRRSHSVAYFTTLWFFLLCLPSHFPSFGQGGIDINVPFRTKSINNHLLLVLWPVTSLYIDYCPLQKNVNGSANLWSEFLTHLLWVERCLLRPLWL